MVTTSETYDLTHIRMVPTGNTGKTLIWEVMTQDGGKDPGGGIWLGEVKWFGRWRGYAFFPEMNTIYEQKCMREIADFIEERNREHRKAKRGKGVWCVRHKKGWCATKGGRRPSEDAVHDEARCGYTIHLRTGSEKREPTCPDCRKKMRLR
jgi:hypothetical protein